MAAVVVVTEAVMLEVGLNCIGFKAESRRKVEFFRSAYGTSPATSSSIFHDIQVIDIGTAKIRQVRVCHFLMTLWWLYRYPTENLVMPMFKIDSETTVRKWVWAYAKAIQALKYRKVKQTTCSVFLFGRNNLTQMILQFAMTQIVWNFADRYREPVFLISIDGTHCPIEEPRTQPDKNWFSEKFNAPGVAYEIGISLTESRLVWVNGPFQAGNNDLILFCKPGGLKSKLPEGMMVIADKGYRGEIQLSTLNDLDSQQTKKFKLRARARHESFNGKIKRFQILSDRFRHAVVKHKIAFEAVCVIVQPIWVGN
jgi:DDE superfamily endonuclease